MAKKGNVPVKVCVECFLCMPVAVKCCYNCGYIWDKPIKPKVVEKPKKPV